MAMAKWTISLFLILTLGASVMSGTPLHSKEEKCAHGMSGMDCCKTALGEGSEQDVATARICCAVNCPQSGTTGSPRVHIPKTSLVLAVALHPATQGAVPRTIPVSLWSRSHGPPLDSNPAYIRNLSLLI
jgi:hypothetical protein